MILRAQLALERRGWLVAVYGVVLCARISTRHIRPWTLRNTGNPNQEIREATTVAMGWRISSTAAHEGVGRFQPWRSSAFVRLARPPKVGNAAGFRPMRDLLAASLKPLNASDVNDQQSKQEILHCAKAKCS